MNRLFCFCSDQLQGQVLGAGQDQEPYTFLDMTQSIWAQPNGKLNGAHSWAFSISPPREVTVPSASYSSPMTYPLPPKFSERGSQAHVDYKIVVTVRRRRFSVDSTYAHIVLPFHVPAVTGSDLACSRRSYICLTRSRTFRVCEGRWPIAIEHFHLAQTPTRTDGRSSHASKQ